MSSATTSSTISGFPVYRPLVAATSAVRAASSISAAITSSVNAAMPPNLFRSIATPSPMADFVDRMWLHPAGSDLAAAALGASRWNVAVGANIGAALSRAASTMWSGLFEFLTESRVLAEAFAAWFHQHALVRDPLARKVQLLLRKLADQATTLAVVLARARFGASSPPPGRLATSRPQLVRGPNDRGVSLPSADSLHAYAAAA